MKRLLFVLCFLVVLAGCKGQPQSKQQLGDFEVEMLFEVDGCRVYRFYDCSDLHYFVTSPGATSSSSYNAATKTSQCEEIPTAERMPEDCRAQLLRYGGHLLDCRTRRPQTETEPETE